MSLYSGWLSAATILSFAISLKRTGIADGWNELKVGRAMLWVATAIYLGNSYLNEDPIYAAVFVWTCFGI